MAAQAFLIAKYWAFTNTFNKSTAPLWFKQLFIYIGKLFPSSNVDAYYLAYAVPGEVDRVSEEVLRSLRVLHPLFVVMFFPASFHMGF